MVDLQGMVGIIHTPEKNQGAAFATPHSLFFYFSVSNNLDAYLVETAGIEPT